MVLRKITNSTLNSAWLMSELADVAVFAVQ